MSLAYEHAYSRLADALVSAVSEERIGVPRFVRWLDRVEENVSVGDSVAAGIAACSRVFDADPIREHRTGHLFHVTVHAVWASGATALISAGPGDIEAETGPEIMILGSSGAVYFDGGLDDAPLDERVNQR